MDNLFGLIFIGVVLFLMFRKGGGMGYYGSHGHGNHGRYHSYPFQNGPSDRFSGVDHEPEIIDLSKDDYKVLPDDGEMQESVGDSRRHRHD